MNLKPFGIAPIGWADRAERIRNAANDAAEILGIDIVINDDDVRNTDDYVGEDYGILTPECVDALKLVAQQRESSSTPPTQVRGSPAWLITSERGESPPMRR